VPAGATTPLRDVTMSNQPVTDVHPEGTPGGSAAGPIPIPAGSSRAPAGTVSAGPPGISTTPPDDPTVPVPA